MAWGERYVGDLLEVTVPALLAPGNLPVLAAKFECEFVVITETQFFDRVADPRRSRSYCGSPMSGSCRSMICCPRGTGSR
jgi:hypothetical protein